MNGGAMRSKKKYSLVIRKTQAELAVCVNKSNMPAMGTLGIFNFYCVNDFNRIKKNSCIKQLLELKKRDTFLLILFNILIFF